MKKKIIVMGLSLVLMLSLTISAFAGTVSTSGGTSSATVDYSKSSSFMLSIPASLSFGSFGSAGTFTISSGITSDYSLNVNIKPTEAVRVRLSATVPSDLNAGILTIHRTGDVTSNLYTKLTLATGGTPITNGMIVAEFNDSNNAYGYAELYSGIATSGLYKDSGATVLASNSNTKAGAYSTSLVFTVSLEAK